MQIYFHIGSPKTGSSTIQNFLYENQQLFIDELDLTYPISTTNRQRLYINGNFLLGDKAEQELLGQIQNSSTSRILFSEELLFLSGGFKRLAQLPLEDHEVKVIAYLRNPADYLASLWGEFNKLENRSDPPSLQTYITSDTLRWDLKTLKQFMENQKHTEFIIRPFDKDQFINNDLIDDFLNIFNIERTDDMKTPKQQNISNKRKFFDVMQILLSAGHSLKFTRNELDRLTSQITSGDDRNIIETIDDKTIQKVCDSHADLIASIFGKSSRKDFSFINMYPNCYQKERPEYTPLSDRDIDRILSIVTLKAQAELVRINSAILNQQKES